VTLRASIAIAPQPAAEAIAGTRDAPMRSHSSSFDQRRRPETFANCDRDGLFLADENHQPLAASDAGVRGDSASPGQPVDAKDLLIVMDPQS
jgi:hypothetical protein